MLTCEYFGHMLIVAFAGLLKASPLAGTLASICVSEDACKMSVNVVYE